MLDQGTLDALWAGKDLEAIELRLRAAALSPDRPADEVAELQTQVARALGLQEKFEEAEEVLAELAQLALYRGFSAGADRPVRGRWPGSG